MFSDAKVVFANPESVNLFWNLLFFCSGTTKIVCRIWYDLME